MSRLTRAIHGLVRVLDQLQVQYALVGGLAVSVRAEPRFTRDVDVAVLAHTDREAEGLTRELLGRSYRLLASVEQTETGRLATVRLVAPGEPDEGVVVDLLFASSGIEPEIVEGAERVEVLPGLQLPVAQAGDLLALKVLARDDDRRPQDAADIKALCATLTEHDAARARQAVQLIAQRGFARGRSLELLLEEALTASNAHLSGLRSGTSSS